MKTRTGVDYNRDAADYAAHRQVHPGILAALLERLSNREPGRLLEVGVGSGNYARAVAGETGQVVVGLDPSISMLREATARGTEHLVLGRAETLPFSSASFSFCYLVDVIHHIRDRSAFAREALRVLSPGGMVVIATDSEQDIPQRVPLASYFPETVPYELSRYPDSRTIESELALAGFAIVDRQFVEHRYLLTDIEPYRQKAFSSLHGISAAAHQQGLEAMELALLDGPIEAVSLYTLFSGRKPA